MTSRAQRTRGVPRRATTAPAVAQRPVILVGLAGLAIVVALAALVAVMVSAEPSGSATLAEPASRAVSISGDPLPTLTGAGADPARGLTIPTLTGTDLNGETISIGPGDGPMAIAIMAHWCSHCQAEVPELVAWLEANGMPERVRVVGLSSSINPALPNYPPSAWFEREGWSVPTLTDDANDRALAALGMGAFPGFVFVDSSGAVVQRMTGQLDGASFGAIISALAP